MTLAANAIHQASLEGVDLICFPECYVPGYRASGKPVAPPAQQFLEQAWVDLAAAAAKANVGAVIGTDRIVDGTFRISALVIDRDGSVAGFQDKVQLDPSEETLYRPGTERRVFHAGPLTFGISICHEGFRYPETVRWAAKRGAQLVFHPHFTEAELNSYRPERYADPENSFHEKSILCRAAENTCFLATVNCSSAGSPTTSAVVRPDGTLLAYQPYGQEGLLIADLDLSEATGGPRVEVQVAVKLAPVFLLLLLDAGRTPAAVAPTAASDLAECRAMGLTLCPQPFDAVLPRAADMLNWNQHERVVGFRNTYRQYQADVFSTRGAPPYPLPAAPSTLSTLRYSFGGRTFSVRDYLRHESIAGLLILKDGRVVYEYYGDGNTDKTLWTSRSVAKSVVSILVGMAIKEGAIGSVDDEITRYLPELKGTAWSEVTLRDLLQHTSGVAWNENYADPTSDFARLTRCEAGPNPYECVSGLVKSLPRKPGVKPGDVWSYNTGGAWLVGRVLESATRMTLAQYLETRLWSRYAMQSDGVWESLVKGHIDMGGHGFNATLRDWGRFGLFVAGGGKLPNGEALLPTDWIAQSVAWTQARGSVTPAAPEGQYGYQWWYVGVDPRLHAADAAATARHTFWAEGIFGQSIAINPTEKLVMVQWATWEHAETPDSLYDEQALFFDALAHAGGRWSGRRRVISVHCHGVRPARAPTRGATQALHGRTQRRPWLGSVALLTPRRLSAAPFANWPRRRTERARARAFPYPECDPPLFRRA